MPEQDHTDSELRRLDRIFDFIREIDKEKGIIRQTYVLKGERQETDAEHAWHMAVMVLLLKEYANEDFDILKCISMLLVHDLVEVYAGDTYCYDEKAVAGQPDREKKSADKLFAILPEDLGAQIRALWEEFELCQSPEARFAKTMDNLQPMMLNAASDGRAWREHGVQLWQIKKRNEKSSLGSHKLWDYAKSHFIAPNLLKGTIKNDRGDEL